MPTRDTFRRKLALVGGGSLVVLLASQAAFTGWAWRQAPDLRDNLLWITLVNTGVFALILAASLLALGQVRTSARLQDQERDRLTHLAELAIMAGGLAHEIRNTLNAMHGQIALLRKDAAQDDSRTAKRIAAIESAVVELEELVGLFLAFARPEKDESQQLDLRQLIHEVVDFAALDLAQGHISVRLDLPDELPAVRADAGKLKRVLMNLLINARQAMPEGGTLTVSACSRGGAVVVAVTDTGIGIPDKDKPHIFETFFSTKAEGTGLGLAIVRRTIEDLHGGVEFDSNPGRTTFRFHLPAVRSPQTQASHQLEDNDLVPTGGRS